jgi:hypothetical protein
MFVYVAIALTSTTVSLMVNAYLKLQRNIAIAKASGFPYVVQRKSFFLRSKLKSNLTSFQSSGCNLGSRLHESHLPNTQQDTLPQGSSLGEVSGSRPKTTHSDNQ